MKIPTCDVLNRLLRRAWSIIAYSDTTQTRFFLALTAAMWTVALLLPGDSFTRATFTYMAAMSGDHAEIKWTTAFGVYSMLAFWRVFSSVRHKWISIIINAIGVALYSTVAFSVVTLPGIPFPAGAAAHCSIALAALWVMIRTQVNSIPGWRDE